MKGRIGTAGAGGLEQKGERGRKRDERVSRQYLSRAERWIDWNGVVELGEGGDGVNGAHSVFSLWDKGTDQVVERWMGRSRGN